MRHFRENWTVEGVATWALRQASQGINTGTAAHGNLIYLSNCTAAHYPTGTQLILTRDIGHHTSGWWKNPDYERCLHLSLCFRDPETGEPREKDREVTDEWLTAVFGETRRLAWSEPPYTAEGKKRDVWHYRVFYADACFTVPILPRGEVYSKEFTERGWLSYSDLQAEHDKARQLESER